MDYSRILRILVIVVIVIGAISYSGVLRWLPREETSKNRFLAESGSLYSNQLKPVEKAAREAAAAGDSAKFRRSAQDRLSLGIEYEHNRAAVTEVMRPCPDPPEKLEDGVYGLNMVACHELLEQYPEKSDLNLRLSFLPLQRLNTTLWQFELYEFNALGKIVPVLEEPVIKVLTPGHDGINVANRKEEGVYELRGKVYFVFTRESPSYLIIRELK